MSWDGKGWKSLLYPTGRYFNSSTNRRSKRNSKEIRILWSAAASTSPWFALFPSRQDVIVPPTDLIWPIPPHSRQAQSPRIAWARKEEARKSASPGFLLSNCRSHSFLSRTTEQMHRFCIREAASGEPRGSCVSWGYFQSIIRPSVGSIPW